MDRRSGEEGRGNLPWWKWLRDRFFRREQAVPPFLDCLLFCYHNVFSRDPTKAGVPSIDIPPKIFLPYLSGAIRTTFNPLPMFKLNNQTFGQQATILTIRRLPARVNVEQAAALLGFQPHDIPALVKHKLLAPLGKGKRNTVKYFAEIDWQMRQLC
jgi:hypothetical protein